jgi:hypothetical protein
VSLTLLTASVSLLWRLLSEQKSRHWERMTYIAVAYVVAYATAMNLIRRLLQ